MSGCGCGTSKPRVSYKGNWSEDWWPPSLPNQSRSQSRSHARARRYEDGTTYEPTMTPEINVNEPVPMPEYAGIKTGRLNPVRAAKASKSKQALQEAYEHRGRPTRAVYLPAAELEQATGMVYPMTEEKTRERPRRSQRRSQRRNELPTHTRQKASSITSQEEQEDQDNDIEAQIANSIPLQSAQQASAPLPEPFQVSPWFYGPVRGFMPQTELEAFMERQAEKQCRQILHIAASILNRAAAAAMQKSQTNVIPANELSFNREVGKLYHVPYQVVRRRQTALANALLKRGIDVRGEPMGECGGNYNFNPDSPIKTDHLYALYLMRASSRSNQPWLRTEDLPDYTTNKAALAKMRPFLLGKLRQWQQAKEQEAKEGTGRAPSHFRTVSLPPYAYGYK